MAGAVLLLLFGIVPEEQRDAAAHDLFTAYVQHSVHLTVGAKYIDLTLDLTFFEEWSWRERQAMDADRNGRITRSELESYVKRLAPVVAEQLNLRIAGREVELVPLYDPEVDLLGNDQAGPGHHRLRLFFFVARPTTLRAGDELVIEDSLWPEAKALGTLQAEGRDGCALEAEKLADPGFAPARPGEARWFKVRCLRPPGKQPSASAASASGFLSAAWPPGGMVHPPARRLISAVASAWCKHALQGRQRLFLYD